MQDQRENAVHKKRAAISHRPLLPSSHLLHGDSTNQDFTNLYLGYRYALLLPYEYQRAFAMFAQHD